MKLTNKLRSAALCATVLAAFAVPIVVSAAKPVPVVTVKGLKKGTVVFNDLFQLTGTADDADGITNIVGNIKNMGSNMYHGPNGQRSKSVIQVPFKFVANAPRTQWATPQFALPAGKYEFRFRAEDASGLFSDVMKVPVTIKSTGTATAPVANNSAPRIAVQFPKNGAVMKGVVVFRGVAKDDKNITAVVGTVMDTNTGLFLGPNGRFGKRGQIKLRANKGQNPQWASTELKLPAGSYLFSAKAVDADGAESQWTQTKFTVAGTSAVATTPQATATTVATGTAANGMNFCSGAGNDADGDGFGWENNSSCVVAGSRADTHPTCASSASDPDGDGFGWENEKSCIVVTHCGSASSDPDGDGFGWENERSCIVLPAASNGRFPACASAASDPDGDGYGWENNKTCLIK